MFRSVLMWFVLVHFPRNSFNFPKKLFLRRADVGILDFGQMAQRGLVFGGERVGNLDADLHQQVAAAVVSRVGHALALERKDLAALRAGRNPQLLAAVQRRHFDRRPQRRLRVADRRLAVQVLPSALKQRMLGRRG